MKTEVDIRSHRRYKRTDSVERIDNITISWHLIRRIRLNVSDHHRKDSLANTSHIPLYFIDRGRIRSAQRNQKNVDGPLGCQYLLSDGSVITDKKKRRRSTTEFFLFYVVNWWTSFEAFLHVGRIRCLLFLLSQKIKATVHCVITRDQNESSVTFGICVLVGSNTGWVSTISCYLFNF